MIHLKCAVVLLAWTGHLAAGGLLPESGYQYNRPAGGQDFGNGGGGGLDGGRRGYTEPARFGSGFTGNAFAPRTVSSSYGAPGFGANNGITGPPNVYNNIGTSGFGNRPAGSYAQSGPAGGFNAGPQNPGYQSQGFGSGYQGLPADAPGYYQGISGGVGGYANDDTRPRPYSFQYEVRDPPSGNDYGQQESSDGNVVRGEYRVLLPDSRTQIVKYTADDANGYNADVHYEGQAQFPRGGGGVNAPGYNQFPVDSGYQSPAFGPLNNYQGRGGGYSGGGLGPSGGIFGSPGGGIPETTGGNGNRYLPPGNVGYGK